MVRIPNIKIPSVRVESIGPTSNIGTGGAAPAPPTPVTYLTQWKIVGNSEVHTLPYPDGVVLPNGYKRCEYLQSDGTAYIELPITFSSSSDFIVIKAAIKTVTDWKGFIAPKTWSTADNKRFVMGSCISKDNKHLWSPALGSYGQGHAFFTPKLEADTDVHTWSYNNGTFIIDDIYTTKLNSGNFTTDNLRIFYGYNTPFASKICDYHHIKADAEYHLIPCLDSNDTPCMYDVINNQAYYNSSDSGSFTYKLYPQPTEIWSCGEYNATDGKYHILIQPQGGSIADIALTEPLRKVNDVADSIEFPSGVDGKALITRNTGAILVKDLLWQPVMIKTSLYRMLSSLVPNAKFPINNSTAANVICPKYDNVSVNQLIAQGENLSFSISSSGYISVLELPYSNSNDSSNYIRDNNLLEFIYELATPTTELIDAPQIAEADSYTCVISQGAKAVSWSSFETNNE